jgi:D-amino-acid oxidase
MKSGAGSVANNLKTGAQGAMSIENMNRRSALSIGVAGAVASTLGSVGIGNAAEPDGFTLPKVDVASDRVTRTVAGLRPYRAQGFRLAKEQLGEKTIIHNYGHGGCGVTLSWGTSAMAVDLALATPHRRAVVLGCGAVGLASARLLQDHGFDVSVVARDLPPNTTSNVAAAMFGVTEIVGEAYRGDPIVADLQQAVRFSRRYFQNFVGPRYGVHWLDFYLIGDQPQTQPWDFAITPELYPLTDYAPGEHPFPTTYASSFPTMMIETNIYLQKMLNDFLAYGGALQVRALGDVSELMGLDAPLIVNCTGLGSHDLFGDTSVVPLKGQLSVLLPQQEITYAYLDGARDLYMFPRSDAIILGGSHQADTWSIEPDPDAAARILQGHQEIAAGMS